MSKEIIKEYYTYDGSIAEAVQDFINKNPTYEVKYISTSNAEGYQIYALVVFKEKENE